jgi:sterol desaturase/sphingolipid hydroxylase (fatty acid hydroxylase superfamily)
MPSLQSVIVGLVVLGAFFAVVQKLWPANPIQPLWRSDSRTDLLYWFLTPLVTKAATRAVIYALFAIAALALGKATVQQWIHPTGLVARQPTWIQVVEILLFGDLIGYWTHRLFHRRPLWVFHAVKRPERFGLEDEHVPTTLWGPVGLPLSGARPTQA